jgi:hypothetical protein
MLHGRCHIDRGVHSAFHTHGKPQASQKPSRNWTFNELDAYNIWIKTVDTKPPSCPDLLAPVVDPILPNHFRVDTLKYGAAWLTAARGSSSFLLLSARYYPSMIKYGR